MADVAPGIITNGLGGNAGNMIVGHFHLGFFGGEIIIPDPPRGPGGVAPAPRPYEEDEKEIIRKIEVIIRIRMGKIWRQKTYWVLPKNAKILVNIFNYVNTTRSRITFAVSGVQNKMKSVIMAISNITNKSDNE